MCRTEPPPDVNASFILPPTGGSPVKLWAKRAFAVSLCVVGFFAMIAGAVAIFASMGHLPSGMKVVAALGKVGVVNSALIVGGGLIFFVLGIITSSNLLAHT